jgi:hypothetical protein
MKCKRLDHRPTLRGRLHRLRCRECRAAVELDGAIASGIQEMRQDMPPEAGLASVLSAISTITPNREPLPQKSRAFPVADAWATGAAVLVVAGVLLWQGNRTKIPARPEQMAKNSGPIEKRTPKLFTHGTVAKLPPTVEHGVKVKPNKIALGDKPAPKQLRPRRRRLHSVSPIRMAMAGKRLIKTEAEKLPVAEVNRPAPREAIAFSVDGDRAASSFNKAFVMTAASASVQPILARQYVMGRVQLSSNSSYSLQGAGNPGKPRELQAW